jgi:L-fuconate dehydratase
VLNIIDVHVADIRFPTSSHSDGSDAMNPDPDYSATYVTLITNSAFNGNGFDNISKNFSNCLWRINKK